jgi:hypothetical protein
MENPRRVVVFRIVMVVWIVLNSYVRMEPFCHLVLCFYIIHAMPMSVLSGVTGESALRRVLRIK